MVKCDSTDFIFSYIVHNRAYTSSTLINEPTTLIFYSVDETFWITVKEFYPRMLSR